MTSAPEPDALLQAVSVTKRFGAFTANDAVLITIRPGEKHALLGENGAGKSTLVKMMYGVLQPDEGRFFWQGASVQIARPAMARGLGIGMVFQHFSVFDALTVAENIALALPPEPLARLSDRIAAISAEYGLAIDPGRAVHTLSVGEKQRVEIIRCLLQDPRLLIMDEPTSVLTPQEAELLFATLNRLAEAGCAILYISHKLEEVRALCDTATILRQGRVVATCTPAEESARSMAEMMIGETVSAVTRDHALERGPVRLAINHLSLPALSEFGTDLHDISLEVHGGEVLGIAGVAGEGQSELMDALSGERATAPDQITIDGRQSGALGPTARRAAGAAFLPEERNGHAAVGTMALSENILLSHHGTGEIARGGFLSLRAARSWVARVRDRFDVRAAGDDPVAASLSGGNLQKFVIGREILRDPGVLVVSQPTWGVDAGAAAVIRRALIDLARSGTAVLVISQDLEEVFAICDRIAVIHHGRLSHAYPASEMTPDKVGLLMGGAHRDDIDLPVEAVA
ncbi:MAG: ABC transporter ATP-binding protein [Pseudomonadota bacterium]